jgi:hypothetical protein
MLVDAAVMAHLETGGIDKAKPAAAAKATLQVGIQGKEYRWHPFNKAVVADQARKSLPPVDADVLSIERFEGAVSLHVKGDQDGHDFACTQPVLSLALLDSTAQQMLLPLGFKLLAEVIDVTKQGF